MGTFYCVEQLGRFQECKFECRSLGRCEFLCVIKGEESGGWGRGLGWEEEQDGEQLNGKRSAISQGDFSVFSNHQESVKVLVLVRILWKTGKDTVSCLD